MTIRYFPEDAVIEILVRIPVQQLLKLRGVCRKWKNLISTQYFKDRHTHLRRSKEHDYSSMFVCRQPNRSYMDDIIFGDLGLIIIDKWEKPGSKLIYLQGIPKFYEGNLRDRTRYNLCSSSGLLVMELERGHLRDDYCFTIYNPITGERVLIDGSETRFRICALFLNPWINEYCVILNRWGKEFEILNLGSHPCCKPLNGPKGLTNGDEYFVCKDPLVVDNANIYWLQTRHIVQCEQLILAFNIRAEEFSCLPHPHPYSLNGCPDHRNMHIITNIHGHRLSFVQMETDASVVTFNIWTLEQQQQQPNWIKTYNINIGVREFKIDYRNPLIWNFKVLTIRDGEMLFQDKKRGVVFAYNFVLQTPLRIIWKYGTSKSRLNFEFLSYVPSFASLNNCPPIICLHGRKIDDDLDVLLY